ncbi:FAD-dependent oxidoreductase [Rubrivirga sp.]|uniref:FAD-dependent oxidoreductase n=1 Tax=Rubrivirga sp. TaxID=1885344 RepID=UPI003C75E8CC
MNRRDFLARTGTAAAGLAVAPTVYGPWWTGTPSSDADIVIYGGGAGGFCAAVQAARMGATVTVIEPTAWIGGMLTSAGVSALDGNKFGAGGGIVHEFREKLAVHYGGYDNLFTGWISLYCYEPHIGHRFLQEIAAPMVEVGRLRFVLEADVTRIHREGETRVLDAVSLEGETSRHAGSVFVAADEYGDGLAMMGMRYRLGRESRSETGEASAPLVPDNRIQDFTYAATLVCRPGAVAPTLSDIEREYHRRFECSTTVDCSTPDPDLLNHGLNDFESFITYAALPNDKVLLNWPHHSNDYPSPVAFIEDRFFRQQHLQASRLHTLQYVRYMQTTLGHPEWQIATDEYPTADNLPMMPYIREARRLVNDHVMTTDSVVAVDDNPRAPILPTSIAVGDYFLDHHHAEHHLPPGPRLVEDFPPTKPYQIPAEVLFPLGDDRTLIGEKSVAVTHIVNGSTRLQPPVMLMGQAIGAFAAFATQAGRAPRIEDVRDVQHALIEAGAQLYIAYDVPPGHPRFETVQHLALEGVLDVSDPTDLDLEAIADQETTERWVRRARSAGMPSEPMLDLSFTRGRLLSALEAGLAERS